MPTSLNLGEKFSKLQSIDNYKDKKKYLDSIKCIESLAIIQLTYHPKIKFLLPSGNFPKSNTENLEGESYATLNTKNIKYLNDYFTQHGIKVEQLRREQMFLDFIATLPPSDVQLIEQVINKELLGLSKKDALKMYPKLFNSDSSVLAMDISKI